MNKQSLKFLLRSDLWRYCGNASLGALIKVYCSREGFRFNFWFRLGTALRRNIFSKIFLYPFVRCMVVHYQHKYGIQIAIGTEIGPGFYIGHYGCIVVNNLARIGKNCNISQGVTIGIWQGKYPVIGDNVYIGPGAKIIGGITIGSNVEIGANAVVTHDIPDNEVWAGVPAKKIKDLEKLRSIDNIDYE